MKIAVIGATGGIGQKVVEQLLEKSHEVIAVARNPRILAFSHERLETRVADVSNEESIKKALQGAEMVVSAIGMSNPKQPTTFYSEGMTNIVKAMRFLNIKRLIAIGGSGYVDHPRQTFFLQVLQKYVVQRILRNTFEDLLRMETVVRESGLDWTIVRPPRLTTGKHTGKYRVEQETVIGGLSISRADVADFIVSHQTDEKTFQKAIGVAY